MKVAVFGRKNFTVNYERFLSGFHAIPLVTLNPGELADCDALLLPGGGDITPAFFGEQNYGSQNIDTELDILQFQALEQALRLSMPILGICKGMQVINVAFGGTILQDLPTAHLHRYEEKDQYHSTLFKEGSCLYGLYGRKAIVNSAHHQGIGRMGKELSPIQWCEADGCVEAIVHQSLPILGLQWHPERLLPERTNLSADPILSLLSSWISASRS